MTKKREQFGKRLKTLRTIAGLSQRELAEKIGVHLSFVSQIERGVCPIPSDKLLALPEVLGCKLDDFDTRRKVLKIKVQ